MITKEAIETLVEIGQFPHCDELPYAEGAKYREYRQKIDGIIELLQEGEECRETLKQIEKIIEEAKDGET